MPPKLLLVLALAFVAGCSAIDGKPDGIDLGRIPQKLIGAVMDPIKDFTVADARTTLAWVDQAEKAGQINGDQVKEARICPEAVIAMSEFISGLEGEKSPEGAKGLIYLGTVKKYSAGGDLARKIRGMALTVAFSCAHLVPVDNALSIMGAIR